MRTDLGDNPLQHLGWDTAVDGQHDDRVLTGLVSAHLHAPDIDLGLTKDLTNSPDDTGTIVIAEKGHVLTDRDVDVEAIDIDELGGVLGSSHGAGDTHDRTITQGQPHPDKIAMVVAFAIGGQGHLHPTLLGEHRCVDIGDGIMHETLKDALQRGQFKDAYIQISHLTADLYINALHRSERQPAGDRAEALSHRLQGSNGLGKDTPLHVHCVGDELTGQRKSHRLSDSDARLFLSFVGRGSQVWGRHDGLQPKEG